MNRCQRGLPSVRRVAGVVLLLLASASGAPGMRAELAAFGADVTSSGPVVVLQSIITEDPDPWVAVLEGREPRAVLNPDGASGDDGPPTVLWRSGMTRPLVAWSRIVAGGPKRSIVLSSLLDGAWTPPVVIAATADADLVAPVLTRDASSGQVHLAYTREGAQTEVVHISAPADLSAWSAPQAISLPGELASRPDAVFHDGRLHVVYEASSAGAGPRQLIVAEREAAGGWLHHLVGTGADSGASEVPPPAVRSLAGRLWVEWVDSGAEVCWRRSIGPDTWGAVRLEPYSDPVDRDFHAPGRIRQLVLEEE